MNSFIEKELRKEFLRLSQEARKKWEIESKERGNVYIKITLPKQTNKREEKTSKSP